MQLLTLLSVVMACVCEASIAESAIVTDERVIGIEWDASTLTLVAHNAGYSRMVRTATGDLLCVADAGGSIFAKSSADNGKTWKDPRAIAKCSYGVATNPELLVLQSDAILCSYNVRPRDGRSPFSIWTTISEDDGKTWSQPTSIFEADSLAENGCWEPAAIQLPKGEIQLFFANESPFRSTAEQEISVLRSKDDGATWSGPERASFRRENRDGMPVPLVLADGSGIVVAIEDAGFDGRFKPAIVHSKLRSSWRRYVRGSGKSRWRALAKPLDAEINAAAPYLRQMPGGETILSVQVTDAGRRQPHMVVYVGNDKAKEFSSPSIPFAVPPNQGCYWNSLFVKDENTITAIAGTKQRGVQGIWAIDGRLIRSRKNR